MNIRVNDPANDQTIRWIDIKWKAMNDVQGVWYLGCHVTFGANAVIKGDIHSVDGGVVTDGQT